MKDAILYMTMKELDSPLVLLGSRRCGRVGVLTHKGYSKSNKFELVEIVEEVIENVM